MVIKRLRVKYLEKFDNIEEGEIIYYSKTDAAALVKEGIAEYVDKPQEKIEKKIIKKEPTREEILRELGECYELIKQIIKEYCDIEEKYLPIISAWIIGTYIHDEFEAYPYLFINAMRGSGKTRLLKLVALMSKNGEVTNSVSEAVLFRTGKEGTLCIDEFEGIGKKESSNLREILNSAYKRGAKVKRMKKKKTKDGETYVVEEFDVYMPIAMANIWGMEEVLGDRCISVVLEKSTQLHITKLIENYGENELIRALKGKIHNIQCSLCSVVTEKNIYTAWNEYIKDKYLKETTLTTYTTNTNYNYTKYIDLFNKIDDKKIDGRNLELSFPLFILLYTINENFLEEILKSMGELMKEKKQEEFVESRDIIFLDFISQQTNVDFIKVRDLTFMFKKFLEMGDDEELKWLNSKWVGRVLKRLSLFKEKRRTSAGIEVLLHIHKAQEKIKMFK